MSYTRPNGGCLEFIGHRDAAGYGDTWYMRERIRTHRLSWILHRGPIPDGVAVMHKCDNPPCINHHHLRLGSDRDNIIDMREKGRHGTAKLTPADAAEIRRLAAAGIRQAAIGKLFGVRQAHVSDIVNGRSWGTAPRASLPRRARLTPDVVRAVRLAFDRGGRPSDIAAVFGVSRHQVVNIGTRKQWQSIP